MSKQKPKEGKHITVFSLPRIWIVASNSVRDMAVLLKAMNWEGSGRKRTSPVFRKRYAVCLCRLVKSASSLVSFTLFSPA